MFIESVRFVVPSKPLGSFVFGQAFNSLTQQILFKKKHQVCEYISLFELFCCTIKKMRKRMKEKLKTREKH